VTGSAGIVALMDEVVLRRVTMAELSGASLALDERRRRVA
jgi:hypothetical protein